MAEVRGAVLAEQTGQSDQRRKQHGGHGRGEDVAPIGPPSADRDGCEVRQREDDELDPRRDGERTDSRDLERSPAGLTGERARQDGEREQEDRVRECLRHQVAVVDHRGRGDCRGRGE